MIRRCRRSRRGPQLRESAHLLPGSRALFLRRLRVSRTRRDFEFSLDREVSCFQGFCGCLTSGDDDVVRVHPQSRGLHQSLFSPPVLLTAPTHQYRVASTLLQRSSGLHRHRVTPPWSCRPRSPRTGETTQCCESRQFPVVQDAHCCHRRPESVIDSNHGDTRCT